MGAELIGALTGLGGGSVMMPPLIFGFGMDNRGSGLAQHYRLRFWLFATSYLS
jgi:uncharacterized membrane protein YfcA